MPLSSVANGNINPATFIKLDTTTLGRCLQSGAGDICFGISQPGTDSAPYPNLDSTYAAVAGEQLKIFVRDDKYALLRIGGTVSIQDRQKSDSTGRGVTTTTDRDEIGAIALVGGVTDDIIPVFMIGPSRYA
jgi:hypothetical protein